MHMAQYHISCSICCSYNAVQMIESDEEIGLLSGNPTLNSQHVVYASIHKS